MTQSKHYYFNNRKFGSFGTLTKGTLRKKSVQEVFLSQNSKGVFYTSGSTAESPAESLNEIPDAASEVIKIFDEAGREILIKNYKNGKYEITAGTVEALVDALTEEASPDTLFIEVFLLTFRHFSTPETLLSLLRKRFNSSNITPQSLSIIRIRVISVLKKWVEKFCDDFIVPTMMVSYNEFQEELNKTEFKKFATQISYNIEDTIELFPFKNQEKSDVIPPNIDVVFRQADFLNPIWSPKKIAQELTLSDLRLFRLIKPYEFCIFLWGDKKDPRINNFNVYVERFNKIGYWVGSVVCSYKDIKKRVEALEKFIQIGKYCHKFQNYNTLMAIHSGMNMNAVSRLKKTWDLVNKGKHFSSLKEIETKLSYRGNYKNYREIEFYSKPPFIPFFGLYIKDLTFMNDGNQKFVPESLTKTSPKCTVAEEPPATEEETDKPTPTATRQLVNFEKCRVIHDKILAIRIYQQSSYKFEDEKDDKDKQEKEHGSIFSAGLFVSGTPKNEDEELCVYLAAPYGPPSIGDEKMLLEMSRHCEPSERTSSQASISTSPAVNNDPNMKKQISMQSISSVNTFETKKSGKL
jgi:hypothetical protein